MLQVSAQELLYVYFDGYIIMNSLVIELQLP